MDGGEGKKKFLIVGEHVASIFYSIHGSSSLLPQSMYTSIYVVYVCATQKRGNFYGLVMATLPQLRRQESKYLSSLADV